MLNTGASKLQVYCNYYWSPLVIYLCCISATGKFYATRYVGRNKSTNSKWMDWFGMGLNLFLYLRTMQKERDFQGSPQSDLRFGILSCPKKLHRKLRQLSYWYIRTSAVSVSEAGVGVGTSTALPHRWASLIDEALQRDGHFLSHFSVFTKPTPTALIPAVLLAKYFWSLRGKSGSHFS